ncbi:TPA: DUF2213 domain-containing protein [Providencia alcalifaciens]|uniref:PF09979 family protein n=1 Tax=Providencia alcalifaciens 205/92 TaxID=1256988 RepID=A0AAV3M2R1_9GAMM|nr:DUF2213 domain-containing protein [Providencia alcalifaciens]EUD10098.1 PF09979 family protein [Providencia alcalifaciens 205/92]MTC26831.1 DUF2213 domain-containing protein [Providencia alcalifaciens]MTC36971.1 DUF2213 domain-containing protein [Providencia alcalifaciens]MTC62865.1 DUF2213 domain-containing protein [Providencia alcalifaciens]WGZ52700.1 DUF2213 domain-containing protein [Providencia alcalifaciens]
MAWKKTSQGYVVTTAKITRAGSIEYYGHEIGLIGSDANKKIKIIRTLEELSKPETLKSFEGLPLTLTHPDSGEVNSDDHKQTAIGHIQNVRIEGDVVVCDVYITDASAIKVLEDSEVREVSVGYEPAEIEKRDGELYHINIRGNHVAVVADGRYGAGIRLNDKKGKPMKYGLKGIIQLLKGKNLKDADGEKLTQEEIDQMIADLEAQLEEMKNAGVDSVNEQMQAIIDELERLKKEKEGASMPPQNDDAPSEQQEGDKDARIAELESENAQLKEENQQLKDELDALKSESDTSSTLTDAKARFPKLNFTDAKSARDIHSIVLLGTGAFNDSQVKGMSDEALRTAYIAVQATSKPKSDIGRHLLNDSHQKPSKSVSRQLGGKK